MDISVRQIVSDLRMEAATFCVVKDGRFVPIGMINDYDRLVKIKQIMVTLKSIGIDTKNRDMRLMFWKKVFDIEIQSTDDIPWGYAAVFINWVRVNPGVAELFGQVYLSWFEKNGTKTNNAK